MSDPFIFEDCKDKRCDGKTLPRLLCAIEELRKAIRDGTVEILSLSGRRHADARELPEMITYEVTGRSLIKTWDTVSSVIIHASHYIGCYSTWVQVEGRSPESGETVTIEIKSRWGKDILNYLLQYTSGIYLPPDSSAGSKATPDSAEWMLVLLWRSVFHQALRRSHIPKEYRKKRTNDRYFSGQLDVARQIRENIADQSRFCCVYSPLTMDTTINQTIRYVTRLLRRNHYYAMLLNDIAVYDERLAAFGVKARDLLPAEVDHIRYTRMSEGYRPLMQISKAIIRRFGAATSLSASGQPSFFVDISEIWENYLHAILTKHLPAPYRVINPNNSGGQWLITGERREIRPDLIIENQNSVPVAIIDAKFKYYTAIGKFARDGVSREDLYQMTTYLYHYGQIDVPLLGLFVCPGEGDKNLHQLEKHRHHTIGVLNFDLDQWDKKEDKFDKCAINVYEEKFVTKLTAKLKEIAGS